jgi:hypothetical protein
MFRVRATFSPIRVRGCRIIPTMRKVLVMKACFVMAAVATAAISTAPLASADPTSQPVPNMNNKAVAGQSCGTPNGRYIFGQDASGQFFVCGARGQPHVWVPTIVIGVRSIGSHCIQETGAEQSPYRPPPPVVYAQSPDGVALTCGYPYDSWEVRPSPTG